MTTRRTLFAAAPALAIPVPAASGLARAQNAPDASKTADFLFVQTAKAMVFDKSGGKLTLEGVSPVTLFFADRPERIAGNMKTTEVRAVLEQGQGQLPVGPAERGSIHPGGRAATAGGRSAAGPCSARRQPDLHCQGPAGRDARARPPTSRCSSTSSACRLHLFLMPVSRDAPIDEPITTEGNCSPTAGTETRQSKQSDTEFHGLTRSFTEKANSASLKALRRMCDTQARSANKNLLRENSV